MKEDASIEVYLDGRSRDVPMPVCGVWLYAAIVLEAPSPSRTRLKAVSYKENWNPGKQERSMGVRSR